MNDVDREWLARIDERTQNIWRTLADDKEGITKKLDLLIEGQKMQNGAIMRNTVWRKALCWIMPSVITLLVGWLLLLTF